MRRLDQFQEINEKTIISGPRNTVRQTIIPAKNNLAGIRVLVYNPKLGGSEIYYFSISDEEGEIIREQKVTESNLSWGQMLRYDFTPINDSAGKKYILSISYSGKNDPDAQIISMINANKLNLSKNILPSEQTDYIEKNYIGIAYSDNNNSYPQGEAVLNSTALSGDLVFQTFYQTNSAGYIKDSMSDFGFRASKDPGFFIFYVLFILGIILILIKRIFFVKIT